MAYNIKEEYNKLINQELKFTLLEEINALKQECINQNNQEYYYLCDVLICDIQIEHNNLSEALKIVKTDLEKIDYNIIKNIYLTFLDRIIYIYITKHNYRLAYIYANKKYNFIDKYNNDSVNRWNLEMSYIYAQMDDLDKSEECLNKIIDNPTYYLMPIVYTNLCKIYVDECKINEAHDALNKALSLEQDEEGKVYCDYLLSKILILKDQKLEALEILKNIFDNEDMNQMTLPIVNDYLSLLYDLKEYEKMNLVISKISFFVNASDDYNLKKDFVKNKIKYLTSTNSKDEINNLIKEYEEINEKIEKNEKDILLETLQDETKIETESTVSNYLNKVDKLVNILPANYNGESLREVVMNFNKSLVNVSSFDESTLFLFNKPINAEYIVNDNIYSFNYKNLRLYEKTLSYDAIKNTIAELVINKQENIAFDFNSSNLDVINPFTNRAYKTDNFNYINVIPCIYQNDVFACMVYASKKNDITSANDTVLLKTATRYLSESLINMFLQENFELSNTCLNHIVNHNNLGLVYISNNYLYFSDPIKNILGFKHSTMSRDKYIEMIAKADIEKYHKTANLSNDYSIDYRLELNQNSTVLVNENMIPFKDNDGNIIFNFGTINLKDESLSGIIDSENEYVNKIKYLKDKASRVEFKYSIIRIKADIKEYTKIKSLFGFSPIRLDKDDFVVVIENETNLNTLERICKNLDNDYSIIRYPRDIVNVEESFTLSKVCLDNHYKTFDENVYKEYLNKRNLNKQASKTLNNPLNICTLEYQTYQNSYMSYAFLDFGTKEDVRQLLNDENQYEYDIKLLRAIIDKNINNNCFIKLSNKVIKRILDTSLIPLTGFEKLKFLVYEDDYLLKDNLKRLEELGIHVYITDSIMESVSASFYITKEVSGIFVNKFENEKVKDNIIKLSSIFNLDLISKYKINEYNKSIFSTNIINEVK